MTTDDGGGPDRLAPVTPLFAGRNIPQTRSVPSRSGKGPVFREDPDEPVVVQADEFARRRDTRGASGSATRRRGGFGDAAPRRGHVDDAEPGAAERSERPERASRGSRATRADAATPPSPEEAAAAGERMLLRKLAARSLSVQEARTVLLGQDVASHDVDAIVERMQELGYLDDAALAEQLVHAGVDRRGQGRHAIAQTLMKRGVPRDVADASLTELPDDDLERALEFARKKASSVGGKDPQAALRRLVGQLSRRGYPSGVAMTAARQALDER